MSKPKITKQKLKEELEDGKTYKQIAHAYGYGYPSRVLEGKIRDLGYRANRELGQRDEWGGVKLYSNGDMLDKAISQADLQDSDQINIKPYTEDGKIVFELTEYEWRKDDDS